MEKDLNELINMFKSLPGIGPKAASRISLYLIENKNLASNLSETISTASQILSNCYQCGNLSLVNSKCNICNDSKRDRTKIAVVSGISDIFAIESAMVYDGLYFVFKNINNLFTRKEIFDQDIAKLNEFIFIQEKEKTIKEIIFALPYSIDSEVACNVIAESITNDIKNIKFSRIGLGMPSGAEFDYTDKLTIIKSFRGRTGINS